MIDLLMMTSAANSRRTPETRPINTPAAITSTRPVHTYRPMMTMIQDLPRGMGRPWRARGAYNGDPGAEPPAESRVWWGQGAEVKAFCPFSYRKGPNDGKS